MMQIIEDPNMVVTYQKRFCRSKKNRIRKKWEKNTKNFAIKPDDRCLVANGMIHCHPEIARIIRIKIRNESILPPSSIYFY